MKPHQVDKLIESGYLKPIPYGNSYVYEYYYEVCELVAGEMGLG